MVVSVQGKHMYLWHAIDSEGEVLDLLVQSKRDASIRAEPPAGQ
jgi:transposase-like protein